MSEGNSRVSSWGLLGNMSVFAHIYYLASKTNVPINVQCNSDSKEINPLLKLSTVTMQLML